MCAAVKAVSIMEISMNEDTGRLTGSREPSPAVSAVPASIPSAAIEEFCADLQQPLEGVIKKFCEQAYDTILADVQFYLGQNAAFNIGSKFDAQQRETVTAYKALRAVEEALTLQEAKANAYAARKGYWSEERAAEYRAQAMSAGTAETARLSPQDASSVPKECAQPSGGDQQ